MHMNDDLLLLFSGVMVLFVVLLLYCSIYWMSAKNILSQDISLTPGEVQNIMIIWSPFPFIIYTS